MDQNYGSVKAQGDNLTLSKGIYLSVIFRNFHTHDTGLLSTKEKEAETRNRAWPKAYYIVCFVALRPKSTAMVIAGRSVHLTTLFPGQA